MRRLHSTTWMFFLAATAAYAQAPLARVGDVTRLQGQGINKLTGFGLVTGLDGTGDGAGFVPTMRALAATMEQFGSEIQSLADVESSKNTAIVMVEAEIPAHGAREGGMFDIRVTAVAAKSLEGGQLLSTPLVYHDRNVDGLFAFAQGRIMLDGATGTTGVIRPADREYRDQFGHQPGSR